MYPSGDDDDADADVPSALLVPLLEEWRHVFVKEMLARLDPTDCAMLAQVGKPWLAVLEACKLPRAGTEGAIKLKLVDFLGSIKMLAWAKANSGTCLLTVPGGCMECFQNVPGTCLWNLTKTCAAIARRGHLEVLKWARQNGFPWGSSTCYKAALGGHLEVLKWARAKDCPWSTLTCVKAASGGHLAVLRWARNHGCDWDAET